MQHAGIDRRAASWLLAVLVLVILSLFLSLPGGDEDVRAEQTLLLTGFGPFGAYRTNPSWEAARFFEGETIGRTRIHTACLDVVYDRAAAQLGAAIAETEPDLVVCLGVAPGDALRIETVARNRDTSLEPDNEGVVHAGNAIREGGPALLPTRLPVRRVVERLQADGFEIRTSDDAGGYLCNHVFYALLDAFPEGGHAGFVHVPKIGDAWSLKRLRRAVRALLEELDHAR